MDSENQNNSITMDLENLKTKYSNLLIAYKASVAEYISYINQQSQTCSNSSQICAPEFISIKGNAYNGTATAGDSSANTLSDCIASCSSTQGCTGATFVSNQCSIRTGDSDIVPSSFDSYAIIPKGKQLLTNMETINQQLITINQQLVKKINQTTPTYYQNYLQSNTNNDELIKNYESLLYERNNIAELLNEYETLDDTEIENDIKIKQNYYTYILLFVIAIVIIIVLCIFFSPSKTVTNNIQTGGDLNKNTYYIIFALSLVIVIINFFSKKS
jgi:hypothetical protein